MENRCSCCSFTCVLFVILCFVTRLEIAETQTQLVDIGVVIEVNPMELGDVSKLPAEWEIWLRAVPYPPNKNGVCDLVEFILDMRNPNTNVAVMRFDHWQRSIERYTTLEESATKTKQELIDQIGLRKNPGSLQIHRHASRYNAEERISNITRNDFAQNPGSRPEATKFLVWIGYYKEMPGIRLCEPLEWLTNAKNGPELVLAIERADAVDKVCVAGKGIKSARYDWDDDGKKQINDSVSSILTACAPVVENSSCYFNQTNGPCVYDEKDRPKDATDPYCVDEKAFVYTCDSDQTCKDICNLASTEEVRACEVQNHSCGYREQHFRPPNADADKFLRHCPTKIESCHVPCPTNGSATTTSGQKSALQTWHIVLIVVGSLAFVAAIIFIIACCICKQKRRPSSKPPAQTRARPPAVDRRRDGGRGRSYDRNYDRGYDPRRPPGGGSPSRPRRHGYEPPTSRGRTDLRPPPRRYPSTMPSSAPPSTRRY